MAHRPARSQAGHGRWRRRLIRGVLILAALPTLIILAYAVVRPPFTPLMVIRLAAGYGLDYRWVPLQRMSPELVAAVIAAEDNRFCSHFGFDVEAIADEVDDWLAGERPRGASTISQQTAKNILLWPGRDPLRKIIEAVLTPQIEAAWSKRRVIEIYLNVIEMGPGIYGAEAAAQRSFGKSAQSLTRREAALIAAVLPNPLGRSAARPSAQVNRRAQRIAARAAGLGPLLACIGNTSR